MEFEHLISEIFSRVMKIPLDEITDSLRMDELTQWDSLKHLMLVSEFEDELDIELEFEDIDAMKTFGDIKNILLKYS